MDNLERYRRQLDIDGWGPEAQERLSRTRVCIAGVGGLGSPVSLYLAAAGVGTIVLCEYQEIELSNLNRQVLYTDEDIGAPKLTKAVDRLSALNPEITVTGVSGKVTDSTAESLFAGADLILDCLDNFETRYVLNRYSVAHGTPFIHAGVTAFYGQMAVIKPPKTPCLECFLPPESVGSVKSPPVLGATAGVVGAMQAAEALKVLIGMPESGFGMLRTIDLLNMSFDSIEMERNPDCSVCGTVNR